MSDMMRVMVIIMVSIVCCVVSIRIVVIIDWVDINLVSICMVLVVFWCVLYIMVQDIVMVMVIVHFMVSWFCYVRYGVDIMVGGSDVWVNMVLLSVLVLSSVS